MPQKRLLLVIAIIAVVGFGAVLLLLQLFPAPTGGARSDGPGNGDGLVEASPNTVQLHQPSVVSARFQPDESRVRLYEAVNGIVRDVDPNGTQPPTTISGTTITNLVNVWWSPSNNAVITLRDQRRGPVWTLFGYTSNLAQTLDASITDVAFAPDGERFAYALSNGTEAVLYTATTNGTDIQRITSVPDTEPLVWWPSPDTILAAQRPTGLAPSAVWRVSTDSGERALLDNTTTGLDLLPSSDGSHLLLSATDADNRTLALYTTNETLTDRRLLPVETMAHKCRWFNDDTRLLCAVPETLQTNPNNPLPDAYEQGLFLTNDDFVVLNAETGSIITTFDPDMPVDATNLIVPPDRTGILFINRRDGRLYRFQTPQPF